MSTDRQTDRQTKNNFFGLSGPQNVKIHQNLEIDFLGRCNTFSTSYSRESKRFESSEKVIFELEKFWSCKFHILYFPLAHYVILTSVNFNL